MALVTFLRQPKKKSTSKGRNYQYALFQKKVEFLKDKYTDIAGNITDPAAYNKELVNVYAENLGNSAFNPVQQQEVLLGYSQATKNSQAAQAFEYELGKDGVQTIQDEINDYWINLWSLSADGVSALSKQDPIGMADEMLNQVEDIATTVNEMKQAAYDSGEVSDKTIEGIEILQNEIDKQQRFYRGVLTDPDRYAVQIDAQDGQVTNFQIVDSIPEKYKKINATYGPLSIIAKPDLNDNINLAGNIFKNVGSGMPYEFDKEDEASLYDAPNFDNLLRYQQEREGDIFKSNDGRYFIVNANRQATAFPDKKSLDDIFNMTIDESSVKQMTGDETTRFLSSYSTEDITKQNIRLNQEKRNNELQQKVEAASLYKSQPLKEFGTELLGTLGFEGLTKDYLSRPVNLEKEKTTDIETITGKTGVNEIKGVTSSIIKKAGESVKNISRSFKETFQKFKQNL